MGKRRTAVIGSGFSGLSAACFLAEAGFEVTVLEKNADAGGRARAFHEQGFTFDMGPSWYWMPDVFENFFGHFGKKPSDYYDLIRLSPSYRVIYTQHDVWDIPASLPDLYRFFDSIEPGSSAALQRFLDEARTKYQLAMQALVYKPGLSLTEFLDADVLKGVFSLHVFESMASYIKKYFKDPRLIQLLEFPVLFLGAVPENTPALYSLMNYADMALGTWYPPGGMHRVVAAMVSLAKELGVEFQFNSTVTAVSMNGRLASGLVVNGEFQPYDFIVAGADYHHVEQHLVPDGFRTYSPGYWDKRVMAPSSLIFYLGLNKKVNGLLHHTLFFDTDFKQHAAEIYTDPQWPSAPQFYVSCPSKTDPSVAPAHGENLMILIPVAPDLDDTPATREKYFDMALTRLENLTGQPLREHIVYKRSYAHRDFIQDYNAYKGNAYGLANTLRQTATLKPSITNKYIKNLYYTGQLTVPGPGVPPAIISGEVVAKTLIKKQREYVN